jgi:Leucine-rich repeat (LRR) protein
MNEILVEEFRKDKNKIIIMIKNQDPNTLTNLKCFKNMEDITIIEAKKINLIKIQKSFFFNLTNLIYLDLRENKLEKFPKNLTLLKNLKILKLDKNLISFIPSYINDLEKLEVLNLNFNRIKLFPSQFSNLENLKDFKVTNNLIENIPIEFGLLKSLEILHFEGNCFTQIPTTLCYLKHLSELSFEWLEFLDPPFNKIIKDNLGKTIINLIRNSLQEMIKKNILFCSFLEFIERNSNNNSNCNISNSNFLFYNRGLDQFYKDESLNNLEKKKQITTNKDNLLNNNRSFYEYSNNKQEENYSQAESEFPLM